MVVCKFFQQGNCRYGQNCRFEHIYGSKYSYHSSAPPQAAPSTTDDQLTNQVHSDVQAALRGGQWLLSCYAPFKEKAAFPGINDFSYEEARLFIYEAKANNNLEEAVTYMNNLFKEARGKYEQLLLKNSNITRALRSIYNGENVAFSFGNMSESSGFGNNAASSVFRSAIQTSPFAQTNQTPSIFSQTSQPSVFSQNNATPTVFQNTPGPASSIFAQANQSPFYQTPNVFNQNQNTNPQNVFGPQGDAAKSIFAQASQNAFSPPTQSTQSDPANIFASASQSVFAQNQQPTPFSSQHNPFSQSPGIPATQNSFGVPQNAFHQANAGDMSVYSKMEELSADDLEAFNSSDFKMGFVPDIAPPHSLCF